MMNDEDFRLLESRLSADARRVGAEPGPRPSASLLAAEFRRRARRRRWTRALCAAAAVTVLGGVWVVAPDRSEKGEQDFVRDGSSNMPLEPFGSDFDLVAIPVLIACHTDDGQPVVVTGWYVPGQAAEDWIDPYGGDGDFPSHLSGTEPETADMVTI